MRRLMNVLGIIVGIAALAGVSIIAVSETGTEVVTVHTLKTDGSDAATRLWVVDDDDVPWLRAGMGRMAWLNRAEARGELAMVRRGMRQRYRVTVMDDPASRIRIHTLMAQKYGWNDRLIDLLRDGENSLAVRLDMINDDSR